MLPSIETRCPGVLTKFLRLSRLRPGSERDAASLPYHVRPSRGKPLIACSWWGGLVSLRNVQDRLPKSIRIYAIFVG
jgi:hypothetical protein